MSGSGDKNDKQLPPCCVINPAAWNVGESDSKETRVSSNVMVPGAGRQNSPHIPMTESYTGIIFLFVNFNLCYKAY